ncbi:hypothetical protein FCL47_10305 [Desulfopila sp. IMCC35006]|uniref:hypothetical protein n=1 Tax=Desulfopila sp. IMCC35006 TaxID=2569542 RepID=UPI0010AD0CFB|nr:hypothetical protein [Desulfopila sp. IMCC35006]TKB26124.1 hypothetical protein FCL47_10305 [Desulfopila sp. IMCC35006]
MSDKLSGKLCGSLKNISHQNLIGIFLLVCVFGVLFAKEVQVVDLRQVDTVMFIEALENTKTLGLPLSASNKTVRDAASMFRWNAEKVCHTENYALDDSLAKNVLQNHAYYAVYLLAPLAYVLDSKPLAAAIHVLIYVIFAGLVYGYLIRSGVGALASLLFVALVMVQPNWSLGVQGQYYFDRLFIPVGFLLACITFGLLKRNFDYKKFILLAVVTFLAASIHERAALMTAIFFAAFCFLFFKTINKKFLVCLYCLSLLLFVYTICIMSTFTSDALQSNSSLYLKAINKALDPWYIYGDPEKRMLVYVFLLVNLLIGFFGFFSGRLMLLALLMMLPNILIWAPGAASKTGWLSHYHSYYFPFLVFASATGFATLMNQQSWKRVTLIGVTMLLTLSLYLVPYPTGLGLSLQAINDNAIVSSIRFLSKNEVSEKVFLSNMNDLRTIIPQGSTVSTTEQFFSALYGNRTLYYFPIGLSKSDFVVLPNYTEQDNGPKFHTAVTYQGKEAQRFIDMCMEKRMRDHGFDVDGREVIGYFSVISKK